MAYLASSAVGALQNLTVQDNAAADAGAQGHKDHGAVALAAALPAFAQSRHIGVVAGLDGHAQQRPQRGLQVYHTPAQVDAVVNDALTADRAGNTDAGAQNVAFGDALSFHFLHNCFGDVGQDVLAVVRGIRGDLPLVQKIRVFIKKTQLHGGAAQVDTKTIFHKKDLHLYICCAYYNAS